MIGLMRASILAAVALNAACIGGGGEVEPAQDCYLQDLPPDPGLLPQVEVALGQRSGDSFEPWSDGELVNVVQGGQGLAMLMPDVFVAGEPETSRCWRVEIVHRDGGGNPLAGVTSIDVVFEEVDGGQVAGPIFDVLDQQPEDGALQLQARVIGQSFTGVHELTVNLR